LGKPTFGVGRRYALTAAIVLLWVAAFMAAQTSPSTPQQAATPSRSRNHGEPTRADMLRGAYGPYRANNDLLFYHLYIRVDPEKKFISGKNTIRFKMLKDDSRIQLDLTDALNIDKILFGSTPLKYERDSGAVFVDFPETLHAGRVYAIDFYRIFKAVGIEAYGPIAGGQGSENDHGVLVGLRNFDAHRQSERQRVGELIPP